MVGFPPQLEGAIIASANSTDQWETMSNEWMACAFSGPSDLGKLCVALSKSGRHFSAHASTIC